MEESNFLTAFDETGKGKITGTLMLYNCQYILQVESDTYIVYISVDGQG